VRECHKTHTATLSKTTTLIMAPPFEEMSDADSISVNSSKVSDEDSEYAVEKILAEEPHHETGEMMYLIKWENYPLQSSTWEPAENLLSPQILSDWQRDKDAVEAGTSPPFNMELYLEIMERHNDEKEERKERRAAKRRRLGLQSRSESVANRSADDYEARDAAESSGDDQPLRGRQKKIEDPTPKRKGVAQKVEASSDRQFTMITSSDESGADSEGKGSVLKNSRRKSAAKASAGDLVSDSKVASKTITKPAVSGAHGTAAAAASVTPATKVTQKRPSARSTAPLKKTAAAGPAASSNFAKRTQPSSSARKSAPSTASAYGNNATIPRLPVLPYDPPKRNAPADPLAGFGKPEPERKGRRISDSNPKAHRFSNLAEENRVRKFSAKESAPDPSVLPTYNFATGKYDEPAMKPRAAGLSSASAANNVFGRREAPAPTRQRSVSPPSATTGARTDVTMPGDNTTFYTKVCWKWRETKCYNDRCTFAHHFITCPDWRQGKCHKREIECKYDHKEEGRDPIFRSTKDARDKGVRFPGHDANTTPLNVVQHQLHQLARPPVPASPPTGKQPIIFLKPTQVPCAFWARGHCMRSSEICKFAHHETGAPTDPKYITCGYWSATDKCMNPKRCMFAHHETAYSTLGPRPESSITCSFWLAGQCDNARCEFAHYETGCRSLGPPETTRIHSGEMSPGEVVGDEPNVAHTGGAQTSPAQTSPVQINTAAKTNAGQTSTAQIIAAARTSVAQKLAAQTTAAQTIAAQTQTGPVKTGVAPTANMIPTSRHPSLPDQHNTNQLAFINDVALEVKFGDFCFTATTQLVCATQQDAIALNNAIGPEPQLFMEQTVDESLLRTEVAKNLKTGARFSTGDIMCKDPRRDYAKTLADELRQISKCGVIKSPTYTLIVHPIGTGEWAFLTQGGDSKSSQAPLRFILLPALPSKLSTSKKEVASENATDTPSEDWLTSVDVERMLRVSDVKTEDKVFIMMPPEKADEMLRMAKVFQDRFKQSDYSGREAKVWTSQDKGKWDFLAENSQRGGVHGGGLLIVDWTIKLWEVPRLGEILHWSSIRVFSVGVNPHLAEYEQREQAFRCQRLFSMGDVVYVTDQVFIKTPEKVLRIIDEVNRSNKLKPPGASRHKIAARPGVLTWLMEFVTEHPEGAEDPRWLKLLHAVWDLCPDDKQDMFYPGNPSEEADMVSEPAELMPTHQALLKTDEAKATDWMVNWFAGWALEHAEDFRRFTICHEEPGTGNWELDDNHNKVLVGAQADPRGWAKEHGYVLCMTPEQWLKEKARTKK
jgi:hypothetical protein